MIGNTAERQATQNKISPSAPSHNLPLNGAGSFQSMTRELSRFGRIAASRQSRNEPVEMDLKHFNRRYATEGKLGYILAWLIGIPLPVLLIVYLLRGH